MALQEIVLNVEGMSCQHCKMAVENAIRELDGISEVTVNLEQKTVTVSYDPGKVSKANLVQAIEDQAYQVKN